MRRAEKKERNQEKFGLLLSDRSRSHLDDLGVGACTCLKNGETQLFVDLGKGRTKEGLTATEVTATTAATTTVATGCDAAHQEKSLTCRGRDHKVRVHVLLAKLFGDVEAE